MSRTMAPPKQEGRKRQANPADWKDPCGNKRQKKRVLAGRRPSGRKTEKAVKKKKVTRRQRSQDCEWWEVLKECFGDLEDPRVNRQRLHLLIDIVVIAICAVIANADTCKDIQLWAQTHEAWLRRFLLLPNGIPSRDTYRS